MGWCHHIIKQQGWVAHVVFSPTNPQHLISASGGLIQKWDTSGHQVGPTYKGTHTAFSPDGTHFISCHEGVSTIWNSDSRVAMAKCQTPGYSLSSNPNSNNATFISSCFSPDGRFIVAATGFTVYVWDITDSDPFLVGTFLGDNGLFNSLTFSPPSTLISASYSGSVKFWQIGDLSTNPCVGDPKSIISISVPIKSVSLQSENGIAISSGSNGAVRTWDLSTSLCKTVSFENKPTQGRDFGIPGS